MTKDEALKLGVESLEWHNQHMHRKISEQAIAAMKKALAQLEQEPVTCIEYVPCCTDQTCPKCKAITPPQRTWVGLTDEERVDIAYEYESSIAAALMVEAKLKEKNT